MNVVISPQNLCGSIDVPPSKSFMHRALICAAIADKETKIKCTSFSKDTEATMNCLMELGAKFKIKDDIVTVTPIDKEYTDGRCVLDCAESGSTLRFMLPLAASLGRKCTFVGAERLGKRPLAPLCKALNEHGVKTVYGNDSFLPLEIEGQLTGGEFVIPGDISSQFITGILFALSNVGGEIKIEGELKSAPYVDITTSVQRQFGIDVQKIKDGYSIRKGASAAASEIQIEGDWSNGAFWLVAGAIGGTITCTGLYKDSLQGDSKITDILKEMGADIREEADSVTVHKSKLHAVTVDASDIPDIVPVLCVAATAAEGTTVFKNTSRLAEKESNRMETTAAMLNALGGSVTFDENSMTVVGSTLTGGRVHSANDHRIAMSAAVASIIASGDVGIEMAEAVSKSYPDFYEKFTMLGGKVK